MSSKNKKLKGISFDRIPLDCWGNVIVFLESSTDFLSICLVIKGLFEYSKHIAPQCTRNVRFRIYKLPTEPKLYVSSIFFNQHLMENDSSIRERVLFTPEFIRNAFQLFPNLESALLSFRSCPLQQSAHIFWKNESTHRNVRDLILLFRPNFSVQTFFNPPFLPKLEKLTLGKKLEDETKLACSPECWRNLPRLKYLSFMDLAIEEKVLLDENLRKKDLKELGLVNIFSDHRISGFEKLRSIVILGKTPNYLQSIENCDKLKSIDIDSKRSGLPPQGIAFRIEELPSLESLSITFSNPTYLKPENERSAFEIKGVPRLKILRLCSFGGFTPQYPVKVYSSALEYVHVEGWGNVDFRHCKPKKEKITCLNFENRIPPQFFPPKGPETMKLLKCLNEKQVLGPPEILDLEKYFEEKEPLVLNGYESLNDVILCDRYTKEIDLPNLEFLTIVPSPDFRCSERTLKKIGGVGFGIISLPHLEQSFRIFVEIFLPFSPKVGYLRLQPCYVSVIRLDGASIPSSSNPFAIRVASVRKPLEEVQLTNFSTMKEFELVCIVHHSQMNVDSVFPNLYILKNIPLIESINLDSITVEPDEKKRSSGRIILENLNSLHTLLISVRFVSMIENVRISGCPNLKIMKLLSVGLEPEKRHLSRRLNITGEQFPNLEKIVITERHRGPLLTDLHHILRIGKLENLKNLKTISYFGEGLMVAPFVSETNGIDEEKVKVKSKFFSYYHPIEMVNYVLTGNQQLSLKSYLSTPIFNLENDEET